MAERAINANYATKAIEAVQAKTAKELNGIAGDKFYNSDNFNKTTVPISASTVTANTTVGTPVLEIKSGGSTVWKISQYYGNLLFYNESNAVRFQLDQSGNAVFKGDVTAFGNI